MSDGKIIRLQFFEGFFVSVEEYEALIREVNAARICGDITLGTQVLAAALLGGEYRYNELKHRQRSQSL